MRVSRNPTAYVMVASTNGEQIAEPMTVIVDTVHDYLAGQVKAFTTNDGSTLRLSRDNRGVIRVKFTEARAEATEVTEARFTPVTGKTGASTSTTPSNTR